MCWRDLAHPNPYLKRIWNMLFKKDEKVNRVPDTREALHPSAIPKDLKSLSFINIRLMSNLSI